VTKIRSALWPLILITSLFFLWGVANNLNDILIKQFGKAFVLDDFRAGLVQSAFYMGYFLLALPAGLLMRRYGYKSAVVVGLLLFASGALLFYPAAEVRTYEMFLLALFVIASGLAFLETSANPLITVLGDPATSERRLNFVQSFNPLGSITGLVMGKYLILSGVEHSEATLQAMSEAQRAAFYAAETKAVQGPYVAIGLFVLLWAALVAFSRFPKAATERIVDQPGSPGWGEAIGGLFRRPRFLFAVVAQFFYVGAQVGVWSYTIRYAQEATGIGERAAADWVIAALVVFLVGRFIGTALMSRFNPVRLLIAYAVINVALCLFASAVTGYPGLLALTAVSFFMSIMFPTIFAVGVKDLGPYTPTGASLIVMAIVGGAVLTPAMGAVSSASSIHLAMIVPAFCFLVVGLFGLATRRKGEAAQLATAAA
jgi:FHS family L-fucose permease-like MFS transporter